MQNRKQFFDMQAEKWDSYIPKNFVKKIERVIMPYLNIKKSGRILDVGSGTGILLPLLRKKASRKAEIIALDYSAKMLQKAREKYGDDFKYVRANAENTPFKNNYFNTVICFSVFPHFNNKKRALKELYRVLRKNGELIIAHADSRKVINLRHKSIKGPVHGDCLPKNDEMIKMLTQTGFKDIKIYEGRNYYVVIANKYKE